MVEASNEYKAFLNRKLWPDTVLWQRTNSLPKSASYKAEGFSLFMRDRLERESFTLPK